MQVNKSIASLPIFFKIHLESPVFMLVGYTGINLFDFLEQLVFLLSLISEDDFCFIVGSYWVDSIPASLVSYAAYTILLVVFDYLDVSLYVVDYLEAVSWNFGLQAENFIFDELGEF